MTQQAFLAQGQVYEGDFTVLNSANSNTDIDFEIEIMSYGVNGQEYHIDLSTSSKYTSITDWTDLSSSSGTLKPNERQVIHYVITVPDDAPGGGQYMAFLVSAKATEGEEEVEAYEENVGSAYDPEPQAPLIQDYVSLASILYAVVDGEIIHNSSILETYIPGFVTSAPLNVGAMLRNDGNVHEKAYFTITAHDLFSNQVLYENETSGEPVLPDTVYYAQHEVENLPALGLVKVSQVINYGGKEDYSEQVVLICPVWFIFIIIFTILITTITIIFSVRHKRRAFRSKKWRVAS